MSITLQAGKTYANGDGLKVYIAGLAKTDPCPDTGLPIYWSHNGNWYREDGMFYTPSIKKFPPSWRDLVTEVSDAPQA